MSVSRSPSLEKYLAIIDGKTFAVMALCLAYTYFCFRTGFANDLDMTMFSIAVIFPLVFTIREAFKRRDSALKFLSLFKASMGSVHYCFEQCQNLKASQRSEVNGMLREASDLFMATMNSGDSNNAEAEEKIDDVMRFVKANRDDISRSMALKIIRFTQDVNESMENTLSLKLHGTPISLRAYCLLFVFMFPIVFTPTIIYQAPNAPHWTIYMLSVLHGFILISLYNVQLQMEDPFDQVGLDDILMDEYSFRRECNTNAKKG